MNVLENASSEKMLKFKLACKSNELSDMQIKFLFTNSQIESEEEITEIVNILQQYRPKVLYFFNEMVKSNK